MPSKKQVQKTKYQVKHLPHETHSHLTLCGKFRNSRTKMMNEGDDWNYPNICKNCLRVMQNDFHYEADGKFKSK